MMAFLLIILGLVLVLPFTVKWVEHNLEYFLFVMGILATITTGMMSGELILHILEDHLLYLITGAVLIAGFLFKIFIRHIKRLVNTVLKKTSLQVFIFLLITVLGLLSSILTAIIASLLLVEIVHLLPLKHRLKTFLTVVSCFSIGLGAALTPIGEPLSTIVVSTLNADFGYLLKTVGGFIVPCILGLGILGAWYIGKKNQGEKNRVEPFLGEEMLPEKIIISEESHEIQEEETYKVIFIRAAKIFIFVIALELLGTGFKPLINTYILQLDSRLLYWINMTSAILDNATMASAEISPQMSPEQIQAILMGLLISGGMLIPGNIPNIIAAGKLQIKSREWAGIGLPIGLILLSILFTVIFVH